MAKTNGRNKAMKLLITSFMCALALSFSGCSMLQSYTQSPEQRAEIQNLEQWIVQQASDYINGNLVVSGKRMAKRRYSAEFVKQRVIVQAQAKFPHLSRATITEKVNRDFPKY